MDNISLILTVIGISILALSVIYYIGSILKLAFVDPLFNLIKIKFGWKEKNEDFYKSNDKKLDNIISDKHSKLIKIILSLFRSLD